MNVTRTIVTECDARIQRVIGSVRGTISNLYQYMIKLRGGGVTPADIEISQEAYAQVQDFFLAQTAALNPRDATMKEVLEHIETLVIERLESQLRTQASMKLDLFLAGCLVEIAKMKANMDSEMTKYKGSILQVQSDPMSAASIISSLSPQPTPNDGLILTEVRAHRATGVNSVLVALDYRELVRSAPQIANLM